MRVKDEIKQDALYKATVKMVNEIGFASSSVSKIAKEAGISPATLYIYHKNKEDLLVSTYMDIKKDIARAIMSRFDASMPIRDILKQLWLNMFDYLKDHQGEFHYTEQFANSPYTGLVDTAEIDKMFLPIGSTIQKGIEQKIIKDVNYDLISAFAFVPIYTLAKSTGLKKNDGEIEKAFTMAWDAIKL